METEINDRVVGTTIVGILAVDKQGTLISINESAVSIFSNESLQPQQLLGRSFLDIFHNGKKFSESGKYTSCLIYTLETGKSLDQKEISFQNRTLLIDSSPLMDNQGNVIGAVAIFRDITDKLLLEEQLLQAEKFAMIGQMSAGLAHELLNPLTVIKGFLQLYEQKVFLESENWNILMDEVDKVNKLVNDFLLLTNPSAPKYKQVSISNLLHEIVEQFESVAEHKGVTVHLETDQSIREIRADLHQIRQVFVNLLMNAFDCLSTGGTIRIWERRVHNFTEISVFNDGPVIPLEIRPRIFDPFFTTKDHGRGLGLAISYRIVENHNGQMFVESIEGKGTTFTVHLPIQ